MEIGTLENPGKPAKTLCWPVARGFFLGKEVTKVLLEPSTGRKHQLRVHLASQGFPIVGDVTYGTDWNGPPSSCPTRMMLHAWRLQLPLLPPCDQLFEAPDPFVEAVPELQLVDNAEELMSERCPTKFLNSS